MLELNTNLLAEIGGWPALKEARALVERGKVSGASRDGNIIRAKVQGTEKVYDPQITLADRIANVEVRCTCAESRRRVCPHILAAGLALLQPQKVSPQPVAAVYDRRHNSQAASVDGQRSPLQEKPAGPKRYLLEDAPPNIPAIEITVLLPLQLKEALAKDPIRLILEARCNNENSSQPWDTMLATLASDFAVSEEDDRLLTALEQITGTVSGINAIPRSKIGIFFHNLGNHPRLWLGKKQRVEIYPSTDRAKIIFCTKADGILELSVIISPRSQTHCPPQEFGNAIVSAPPLPPPLANWTFDGTHLIETPALPPGFFSGTRLIPSAQIPDFLSREFPNLERTCELVFAPGFAEFQLEIGQPTIEARLEGALSGLTLDLVARYDDKEFSLNGKTEPSAYQRYVPDPRQPNRFWRRNVLTEREALAQVTAAGFTLARSTATTFSLTQETNVTRFLANILPRWKQSWKVSFGSRLEETLKTVDIAQPEFSLRSGGGNDWLSLDLKLSVGGKPIPLDQAEIQRWLQTGQSHTRTANKRTLLIPTEAWGEMQEVLADCAVEQEPGQIRVNRKYAPFLAGALNAQGFHSLQNVSTDLPRPNLKTALDENLLTQLRPYQLHGVEWLSALAQQNLNGLLADDMGLGKTLQALAFCAWLKKVAASVPNGGPTFPSIIICPTSLVTNWLREAARFTPHLRTLDLTGPDRAQKFSQRHHYDLLVTSYAILRRDIELYRTDTFSLVVLDEAQHIKNRSSQNAQSAKSLRSQHRLILTGTPLENSVLDLWSLYDFLLPGYLGTSTEFKERYETPLTKEVSPKVMERLRHRVKPFFLRRTKEEVLTELPPKLEHLMLCELTPEQREVYQAILAQGRRDVFEHSGNQGQGRDRIAVLTTLLRLRQVCCHLDLLPHGDEKRSWKEPSAKLDRTFELIDEAIDGGHRVLLFSQFVKALHLLRDEAKRREMNFCYLDGQTVERQAEVDRFQNDSAIPLFFISLKAGGTGLNLTGADTVIHFDPWWNPAAEEQSTSRAHRMGQSRSVQAYKLIAAGTVEEKIQALQARKRELFEASFGGDAAFVEKLTSEDLEELLA